MTVPVLRAINEQYPHLKITVLTREMFAPFFKDLKNVEVFVADLKGKHKGVLGLYKLSAELKTLNFNAVADLHNVLRSKILKLFFFRKKVIQLDKGRADKKALTSGKLFQQLKTTHQRYADVFEKLGYVVDLSNPTFPAPEKLSDKLGSYISNKEYSTIGIAPFATYKSKIYPLEQMEIVIENLSRQYNIILFGGGADENKILKQFETKYKNVSSLAGKLSLGEELKLMSHLDVMLSMDSGNAHLAAMLGKPVVTIWGVTHPYAGFSPFNQPENYALKADREKYPQIPTSVYGNKYPKGYENAAGSISVEEIVEKVKSVITS